jgi:hypothetical protein
MAAYKPPPASGIAYVGSFQIRNELEPSGKAEFASAIEPGAEGIKETAPPPAKLEKPSRGITRVVSKRARAAPRRERRDPMMDFAAQPFFGSYRPWY